MSDLNIGIIREQGEWMDIVPLTPEESAAVKSGEKNK